MCISGTTTLSDVTSGGTWLTSSSSIATVGSSTGIVSGVGAGSATITYSMGGACYVTAPMKVYPNPAAITGTPVVCTGFSTTLSDAVSGGTWTSGNTAVATVGTAGVVYGASAGTSIITYSFGGNLCMATTTVVVNQSPPSITGTPYLCPGTTTTLSDATSGGTWISNSVFIASVGSTTGIVNGLTVGTSIITYKLSTTGCYAAQAVTVNPLPSNILGTTVLCAGTTTSLSDPTSGGTWTSSSSGVASISTSGVVTAVSGGTAFITYTLGTGCITTATITVNPLPGSIFGTLQVCPGNTNTLADDSTGGTWSVSDNTIASIGSTTGLITGELAGTITVTYTLSASGCLAVTSFTVNPTPDPISGVTTICLGTSSLLSDIDAGGTWMSRNTGIAVVGATSGLVTGLSIGGDMIIFVLPTGCSDSTGVTVYPNPPAITGASTVCVGNFTTLGDLTGGGTWFSTNTAVALVVSSSGVVTGVSAGTSIISYTLSTGCYVTTTVTVAPAPSALTGTFTVCTGSTTTLSDLVSGGTWTSSNVSMATVGSTTGVVTGVSAGSANITYSLGGTCRTIHEVTVYASPLGITGTTVACVGSSSLLSDATTGGTWSSSSTATATTSSSGAVTGVSGGTAIITYKVANGCIATTVFTVNPTPSAITGTLSVCVGSTTDLGDAVSGGTWLGGTRRPP